MSTFTQTIQAVQAVTLAARARTGDAAISTRVGAGTLQVVRVIKHDKGPGCNVLPVTGYMSIKAALAYLDAMQSAIAEATS